MREHIVTNTVYGKVNEGDDKMDKGRVKEILFRLDNLADNLEKEALYYRKSIKEIKDELKKEGLL